MSITSDVVEYIRRGEKDTKKLGLEIEHFIVDEEGNQIGFEEVTKLINQVVEEIDAKPFYTDGFIVGYDTGDYTITLEPACQFEISIRPESNLEVMHNIYQKFLDTWEPIFQERGYKIITAGNLPNVELGVITPDEIPLSPKLRYKYMDRYFKASGRYGRYMMRASGSTQISIDYNSEEDMVRKLRILQKISPILMIMMENKADENSHLPGYKDRPHLLRTQEWDGLDPLRTGYFPHVFDVDFDYKSIANTILSTPLILLNKQGETSYVGSFSAFNLVDRGILDYDKYNDQDKQALIEHFISMGFFHYRIKKYIEIRVADADDIDKSLAYVALIKGLMYHEENLASLEWELRDIGCERTINQATEAIEIDGYDAIIYDNKSARQWADRLIEIASHGLDNKDRQQLELLRR